MPYKSRVQTFSPIIPLTVLLGILSFLLFISYIVFVNSIVAKGYTQEQVEKQHTALQEEYTQLYQQLGSARSLERITSLVYDRGLPLEEIKNPTYIELGESSVVARR